MHESIPPRSKPRTKLDLMNEIDALQGVARESLRTACLAAIHRLTVASETTDQERIHIAREELKTALAGLGISLADSEPREE